MKHRAAFIYRDNVRTDTTSDGRPRLFDLLRDRDVDPFVTLGVRGTGGAEMPFRGEHVQVHRLEGRHETIRGAGLLALRGQVDVAINRAHRSLRLDDRPMPPMINENATRSLSHRKHRVQAEVLEPIGTGLPTKLITHGSDIDDFLMSQQRKQRFVVKPDGGTGGKQVRTDLSANGVKQVFMDDPDRMGSDIVQPQANFSGAFPAYLRPYDDQSRDKFEGWSRSHVSKELGMYAFYAQGNTTVFPAARAHGEDGDEWFFVDPDSVADHTNLPELTQRAFESAAELTDATAVYGRLDFGYDPALEQTDGWTAIEMNMKAPQMIGYDNHAEVADNLRVMFADQIAATAEAA